MAATIDRATTRAEDVLGSVSSRRLGMSPRSLPPPLPPKEHGLIPEQRLDTEPKDVHESIMKYWSIARGVYGIGSSDVGVEDRGGGGGVGIVGYEQTSFPMLYSK